MSTAVAQSDVQLLKLFVSSTEPDNPTIAVRWCVDPMLAKELADREAVNPHLLLVVWSERRSTRFREERWLIPLDKAMEYIQLTCAGRHFISGTVVWNSSGKYKQLFEHYLARRYSYIATVIFPIGDHSLLGEFREFGFGPIEVTVDKEHFASEPPEWEKWWVNLWHGGEMPIDQCRFGRRRPMAYTIQPIVMTLYWIGKVIVSLLYLGFGLLLTTDRWPHLDRMFQPWKYNPTDTFDSDAPIGTWYNRRRWMFTPLAWIGALIVAKFLLWVSHRGHSSWWLLLGTASLVIIASIVLILVLSIIDRAIVRELMKTKAVKPKVERPRPTDTERRQQLLTAYEREFAPLLCRPGVQASLDSLPPEKRSLSLRFNAFKTKVCRPFAS